MPTIEQTATMIQAVEEVGDDELVVAVLLAMRDEGFRDELRALIDLPAGLRRSLRASAGAGPRRAHNDR